MYYRLFNLTRYRSLFDRFRCKDKKKLKVLEAGCVHISKYDLSEQVRLGWEIYLEKIQIRWNNLNQTPNTESHRTWTCFLTNHFSQDYSQLAIN